MKPLVLKNNNLEVVIAAPNSVYKGSRFDGTGIITDLQFMGHSFCTLEQKEKGKGSGGIGFCNEFGIDKPIDYDRTAVGDCFPKIGVGMISKEADEDYDFFKNYQFDTCKSVEELIDSNTYQVTSTIEDQGIYSLTLIKTISIKNNSLTIDYVLQNNGKNEIQTNEYNHNFMGIDVDNIGKFYSLYLPNVTNIDKVVGEFDIRSEQSGFTINWNHEPDGDFYATMELGPISKPFNWELRHSKAKVGVRECSVFPISKMALWGFNHVVCPEVFIDLHLPSKESISWARIYEFFES